MKYVISFDITDDRKRYRAVKILLEYGYRVQKSVFEGFINKERVQECRKKLVSVIDPKTDSVRIYPLCGDCEAKVAIEGCGKTVEETAYIII